MATSTLRGCLASTALLLFVSAGAPPALAATRVETATHNFVMKLAAGTRAKFQIGGITELRCEEARSTGTVPARPMNQNALAVPFMFRNPEFRTCTPGTGWERIAEGGPFTEVGGWGLSGFFDEHGNPVGELSVPQSGFVVRLKNLSNGVPCEITLPTSGVRFFGGHWTNAASPGMESTLISDISVPFTAAPAGATCRSVTSGVATILISWTIRDESDPNRSIMIERI